MAELAKKLHFLKDGTEQTAKAYSTTGEAGSSYIPSKIDGVACYIPIGSTSDVMATNGRVIKGGTTYAIKSQSKPAYTEVKYTEAGTYTWTAPAGVTRVRVAVCGGGGGASVYAYFDKGVAGSGSASQFGTLIQATGGGGAMSGLEDDGEHTVLIGYGGSGGSPNGRAGNTTLPHAIGKNSVSGGTGFALSFTLSNGRYGQGGGATSSQLCTAPGSGGGSGGYNTGYVNVTSGSTYTVIVGRGGNYKSKNFKGTINDGGSGFVLIAYGGDI